MVCVTVLGSGSKGNCTVVSTSRTRIALDAGLRCKEIVKRMRLSGEEPEKLDGILITHEHQDHVQGLSVLARRWNIPVYATQATHTAWREWITPRATMSFSAWLEMRHQQAAEALQAAEHTEGSRSSGSTPEDAPQEIPVLTAAEQEAEEPGLSSMFSSSSGSVGYPISDSILSGSAQPPSSSPSATEQGLFPNSASEDPAYLPCVEHFRAGVSFQIGDICVTPFTIPHDAVDPVGFVLQAEGMRIVVATDLGYLTPNVRMHLRGADMLIVESNHDVEMLRDGPYPWVVKQRVLSRVGHLSNDALGEYLASDYDGGARYVVLAHLSESNNLPELARSSAERALNGRMCLLGNKVLLASQQLPLESIQL